MTLEPLKTASTDDLVAELKTRFDSCLIAGLTSRAQAEMFFCNYYGLTTCIGLAERAKARLIETALASTDADDSEF